MLWPTHAPLSDSFIVTDETIRGSKYSCRRQFYELGEGRVNDVSPGFLNRNHLLDCISSPVESLRTHTHTLTHPLPLAYLPQEKKRKVSIRHVLQISVIVRPMITTHPRSTLAEPSIGTRRSPNSTDRPWRPPRTLDSH